MKNAISSITWEGTLLIVVVPRDCRNPSSVDKKESLVSLDWAAKRRAKLISFEGWYGTLVEIVLRIERAVSQKLVCITVELIRS